MPIHILGRRISIPEMRKLRYKVKGNQSQNMSWSLCNLDMEQLLPPAKCCKGNWKNKEAKEMENGPCLKNFRFSSEIKHE